MWAGNLQNIENILGFEKCKGFFSTSKICKNFQFSLALILVVPKTEGFDTSNLFLGECEKYNGINSHYIP